MDLVMTLCSIVWDWVDLRADPLMLSCWPIYNLLFLFCVRLFSLFLLFGVWGLQTDSVLTLSQLWNFDYFLNINYNRIYSKNMQMTRLLKHWSNYRHSLWYNVDHLLTEIIGDQTQITQSSVLGTSYVTSSHDLCIWTCTIQCYQLVFFL